MGTFSRGTSLDPLDPWYVTGFVEGDGTFTYSRSGRQMGLYFVLKLTAEDTPLLEIIQSFFGGIGKIYRVSPRAATASRTGHTRTASYYRVCRHDDLEVIVSHLDRYPLHGVKAAAYAIWREMVVLKRDFRNPQRPGLQALAVKLSSLSPRNRS